MEDKKLARVHLASRVTLAFVFIYHGLVPKLLSLSEIEVKLTEAHHFTYPATLISTVAGTAEVFLGLAIFLLKKSLIPIHIANIILIALLIDVAIVMPKLLFEAFNPVTTNLVCIVLGYIIIITQKNSDAPNHNEAR